ncbi:MAG TPA: PDZ domain-containing protein [Thermoanaerobaculia bacterium]|nr:PDZ domain-containing protein [Thermoanaerobaculia bacterium]
MRSNRLLIAVLVLLSGARAAPGRAEALPEPITYTLRFPSPESHTVDVEAVVPTGRVNHLELMMPVWTPGSYVLREYAGQIEEIAAGTPEGFPLELQKTAKNRWRVIAGGRPRIVVRYRVYGRELSVRGNYVERDFAVLNGAATFLTPAAERKRTYFVQLEPAPQWATAVTALEAVGGPNRFRAPDYDALVDSPILLGNPALYRFEAGGRTHLLANEGEGGVWDGARSAAELERVVREQIAFWGNVPYDRFVFLNLIVEATGGLEHAESFTVMTSRWKARTRDGWLDWLGLVSHELFHAWNVKRLRPRELQAPFEYETEVYTPSLWIVEGLTSYYDDLLVHRAGLSTRDEYLKRLSRDVERLQTAPGRLVQPLVDSSFDAWIKHYRRDENTPNSGVSYYTKGALVGFLLDARIRRATAGGASLDDVMRRAFARWSGPSGYRHDEFLALLSEVAASPLGPWLQKALETTEELDYAEALAWFGLRFKDPKAKKEGEEPEEPAGWLGVEAEARGGRLVVTEVRRGTPAHAAGVNVEDEILALGGFRVPPDKLDERLAAYRPGEKTELLVARRERLVTLALVLGEEPGEPWRLEVDPGATPEQTARLDAWLGRPQKASVQARTASPAASTATAPK